MAEETVEEFAARQRAEYSQYVAVQDIYVGGALAYVAGHAVPASNVQKYGYLKDKLVERVASQTEAKSAAAAAVNTEKG